MTSPQDNARYEELPTQLIGEPGPLQAGLEWLTHKMIRLVAARKMKA